MALTKTTKSITSGTIVLLALGAATLFLLRHRLADHMVVASGEHLIEKKIAMPVDMTGYVNTPASYFEKITQFPAWKTVPIGSQVFDGVPIQIDGMICLWGEGNAEKGLKFPEEFTGIQMNNTFETLYIYHGSFFESPPGTPVYEVVFRYEDGSSATNQILYGSDVLDWYMRGKRVVGPTGARSKLAWHSEASPSTKAQPLRFCMTAVENPEPLLQVTSIDLFSCKSRTAACILAFTAGKSGLMK